MPITFRLIKHSFIVLWHLTYALCMPLFFSRCSLETPHMLQLLAYVHISSVVAVRVKTFYFGNFSKKLLTYLFVFVFCCSHTSDLALRMSGAPCRNRLVLSSSNWNRRGQIRNSNSNSSNTTGSPTLSQTKILRSRHPTVATTNPMRRHLSLVSRCSREAVPGTRTVYDEWHALVTSSQKGKAAEHVLLVRQLASD